MTVAAVLLAVAALGGVVSVVGALLLEGRGFCLSAVGGWYGGRLVFHHGVGREKGNES